MSRIVAWFDERMDLRGIYRGLLDRPVPSGLTWWHTLGSATLTAFVVQVTTGIVLATFFSASPDHAYDSVRYIEQHVVLGAFLRGLHTWGASAMVVLALAHMLRVFSMGAYKYPREANWLVGVGLLAVVIGFGFTGYLLPWDQKAYWGTQVGTSIAGTVPLVGPAIAVVLKGGTQLGAATLARFYAVHVLWLPVFLVTLIAVHMLLVIRQGIAAPPRVLETGAPERTSSAEYAPFYRRVYAGTKHGERFWPDVVGKDLIVSLGLVLMLALLAWARGAALESPAGHELRPAAGVVFPAVLPAAEVVPGIAREHRRGRRPAARIHRGDRPAVLRSPEYAQPVAPAGRARQRLSVARRIRTIARPGSPRAAGEWQYSGRSGATRRARARRPGDVRAPVRELSCRQRQGWRQGA